MKLSESTIDSKIQTIRARINQVDNDKMIALAVWEEKRNLLYEELGYWQECQRTEKEDKQNANE